MLCHSTPVRTATTLGGCMKKDSLMPGSTQATEDALSPSCKVNVCMAAFNGFQT